MNLQKLGYDVWAESVQPDALPDYWTVARVIEVRKNGFMVSDGDCEMQAELPGRFLFDAEAATDFPTVGDWVAIQRLDGDAFAILHSVLPRKTLMKRKEAGKKIDFQLIAANIDFGLVVQSAEHPNFNLLDRYFVMLNESGIQPVAVFSKIDLLSQSDLDALESHVSRLENPYLLISNTHDRGVEQLAKSLQPAKTYCLLGPSGVGKTSLLNNLLGSNMFKIQDVRQKDRKGRHTTVRRQLICLEAGSIFIDTPGMRELGNFEVEKGLDQTFEGFSTYASQCRFRDCTHTHEKGCALVTAVQNGDIEESRYLNFLKMKKESEFYGASYVEKRKREKSFGKIMKNYRKTMRKY